MNWLLYAILGAVMAGASFVFAKSGMHKSNSYLAAALRGTFLYFSAWYIVSMTGTGMSLSQLGRTNLWYLLLSGVVTGIVWICLLRALQLGEVVKVVPVVEASIVLNMLIGILFFHDSITWNKILIMLALGVGTIMMATKGSGRGGTRGAWLGYALGAMVFTTLTVVLSRIGITGIHNYYERLIRYAIALVLVWIVTFATKGYKGLRSMSFLDGLYLCMSGAAMGGSWYCLQKAYAMGVNAKVEMVEHFDLVAAVVLGCVFMRERLSVKAIFGMIFMMIGFWILLADLPVIPL